MHKFSFLAAGAIAIALVSSLVPPALAQDNDASIQLGPRPFFLV